MPITAGTFIVGWLAIAGVPPFAGFWSKDEILAYTFDNSPVLWALGLVTALLTAYYMSRQVFLVFFGEARWDDDVHPHESPWTMTAPLVVLAGCAAVAGFMNLPFSKDLKVLEHWLEPVVHSSEAKLSLEAGPLWLLGVIAVVTGLVGVVAAAAVYLKHRRAPVEPEVLAQGWYIDDTIARTVDGPGRAGFEATATFDRVVVDGAVNGVAALVRGAGGSLRRVQTGYVRNYALLVAAGTVALVAYVVVRTVW